MSRTAEIIEQLCREGVVSAAERSDVSVAVFLGAPERRNERETRRYVVCKRGEPWLSVSLLPQPWPFALSDILATRDLYATIDGFKVPRLIAQFATPESLFFVEEHLSGAVGLTRLVDSGSLDAAAATGVVRQILAGIWDTGEEPSPAFVEQEKAAYHGYLGAFVRAGVMGNAILTYIDDTIDRLSPQLHRVLSSGDIIDRNIVRVGDAWYLIDFEFSHPTAFFFKEAYRTLLLSSWAHDLAFRDLCPFLGDFPEEVARLLALGWEHRLYSTVLNPRVLSRTRDGLRHAFWDVLAPDLGERLDREIATLRRRAQTLEAEAQRRQAEAASLQDRLSAEANQRAALQQRVADLEQQAGSYAQQVGDLHRSASWRVTAPLRWLGRPLVPILRAGGPASAKVLVRRGLNACGALCGRLHLPWLQRRFFGASAVQILRGSELFDRTYYLANNPDVAAAHVDPLKHFVRHGAFERRNPSRLFDTSYYLDSNPDVAAGGVNPLAHYVEFGACEGRRATPRSTAPSSVAASRSRTVEPRRAGPSFDKGKSGTCRQVLVVDARTIMPDHDSGSLRMFNLLSILRSLNCEVTFIPDNLDEPERYVQQLEQYGIEIVTAPEIRSLHQHLEECGDRYDVVILSRVAVASRHIDAVRALAPTARVIFDTVDLHFLREEREAMITGDQAALAAARRRRAQEIAVARKADATVVVSSFEKQVLERESPGLRVSVVSNIHSTHPTTTPFEHRQDFMFVGGFEHPPNVDAVLFFVKDVLPLIRDELIGAKLYVIGTEMPPEITDLRAPGIEVVGYVPDLLPYFSRCKLSVAPLRYGAGVKGKINSSMSYGVPVVATSAAAEGMELVHEQDVLIADAPAAFATQVIRLYRDKNLWTRLSQNGIDNISRHFSFQAARTNVEALLASVIETPSQAQR